MQKDGALGDVIAELEKAAKESRNGRIGVGQLVDALDQRGYGAVLAVLPLIEITPLGGIPGVPTALALLLAIITTRLLMGYEHFYAPDWLRRRQLTAAKVLKALKWLKPISARIDATLNKRLSRFAGSAGRRAAGIVILGLLLTVPPLELVPFATTGPMVVIALFGLGMLYRDGLVMLSGFAGALLAVLGGLWGAGTFGGAAP
ncbi:exopolysaccharide biosynthesis protein [Sagittula salina]|uniref:Exopolysaccharide biosynthesis protein n=1 Tax=Sagittula salina TaxID=2820268 RepID=A0A940S5E6_9RHOB|nr:exopolysaccharide biosynthesis protein [Sagittula salina]MBP0485059.1 exopolysaccharide biosynthesis protein [Sagittula salina]